MDIVYIRNLEVETVIGVFDWEREIRQRVSIDLEMQTDVRRAAATDKLEDAVDYKAIGKRVIAYVTDSHFGLVETLAERIAEIVLAEFGVGWLRLRVSKPGALRGASDVGVLIERGARA